MAETRTKLRVGAVGVTAQSKETRMLDVLHTHLYVKVIAYLGRLTSMAFID
jgi:hypothetical protein